MLLSVVSLLVLVLLHVNISFEHLLVQERRKEHLVELSWLLFIFLDIVGGVFKYLLVHVKDRSLCLFVLMIALVLNELEERDFSFFILFLDIINFIFCENLSIVVLIIQLIIGIANITINICTFIGSDLSLFYLIDIFLKTYKLIKNFISSAKKPIISS